MIIRGKMDDLFKKQKVFEAASLSYFKNEPWSSHCGATGKATV